MGEATSARGVKRDDLPVRRGDCIRNSVSHPARPYSPPYRRPDLIDKSSAPMESGNRTTVFIHRGNGQFCGPALVGGFKFAEALVSKRNIGPDHGRIALQGG